MGFVDTSRPAPKAMAKVCILDILAGASEESPVSQDSIRESLDSLYGISIDRKTVGRHLSELVASIANIRYREVARRSKGSDTTMMTDFWLKKSELFEEVELRALIYETIFSRHMPTRCKMDIVEKLESLSSVDLRRSMGRYAIEKAGSSGDYNQLFLNMELIDDAMQEGVRISFRYSCYEVNKHLRESDRVYTVSPLGIGVRNGDFVLASTLNGIDNDTPEDMLDHFKAVVAAMEAGEVRVDVFRLDRMRDIVLLEAPSDKPGGPNSLRLKGACGGRLNVLAHLTHNPSLSSGHTVTAKISLSDGSRFGISDVIDFFGRDGVRSASKSCEKGRLIAVVRANSGALKEFALMHPADVEILEPEDIRECLKDVFQAATLRYSA